MHELDSYDDEAERSGDRARRIKEFDCPECNANNPYDDGIAPGDEVRCYYCGSEFEVELTEAGKWRFRSL
jgi:transcription elongation factor Elf1